MKSLHLFNVEPFAQHVLRGFALLGVSLMLSACAGTQVAVNDEQFPVPLVEKTPLAMGIYLSPEIRSFVHQEPIEKRGNWKVDIGSAQEPMFQSLAEGMFQSFEWVDEVETEHPNLAGVLAPTIEELQFSTPKQTRSDYYEVWIRYQFKLYNSDGSVRGEWPLTAYGKANTQNYSLSVSGPALQEAALAACRDAMAFFTLQFHKVPAVQAWLADNQGELVQ